MNTDEFWKIVERVHAASPGDMQLKCQVLTKELLQLPAGEVESFDHHFSDCFFRAYSDDLWGAAHVIGDGCGDDGFMDFRSTLISLGRTAFETGLTDPDLLVEFNIEPNWAQYQGYQDAASKVYKDLTGHSMPTYKLHPQHPSGTPFNEWEMSQRYHKLVSKYGYRDSDWMYLKVQVEEAARKKLVTERLVRLLLESGVIPSCGLIPPFKVVAKIMRTGRSPQATGKPYTWETIELQEGDYWSTVVQLEKLTAEGSKCRPDLHTSTLRQDLTSATGDDFDLWIQALKERGLM